ncbi:MAG: ZIP family metal transporter [Nannocystales bacterium]
MPGIVSIVFISWAAGLAAVLGAVLARLDRGRDTDAKDQLIHGVVAFGGGILLAAVSFALVPEGFAALEPAPLVVAFCVGGLSFGWLDSVLDRRGGGPAQLVAMVMDFVPEALSLCAVFAQSRSLGILLASFIGAQNLPEGFNAYRELGALGVRPRVALMTLLGASLLGPLATMAGHLFLRDQREISAGIMVFAAGGILYLVFQDIAPKAKMSHRASPALGAVLGFALGMLGKSLLG